MRAPDFWYRRDALSLTVAAIVSPLAVLYWLGGLARRAFIRPQRVSVPVICVGNLTVGGTGKTPTVLAIVEHLRAMGRHPAILTRGYGGSLQGPVRVDPRKHDAGGVGDEALLLAHAAPTIKSADRRAGAALAIAGGADCLIMDDGFQNGALAIDLAILVIDAARGLGNGFIVPAGPLRESARAGLARAQAVLLVGEGTPPLPQPVPPLLRARLGIPALPTPIAGQPLVAFAGIGEPAKFFRSLARAGGRIVGTTPFPDHHAYRAEEIAALHAQARAAGAALVTTEKDFVRLPLPLQADVVAVPAAMRFESPDLLDALLERACGQKSMPGFPNNAR
ncbi:MAG: tetraacyldisaccharide 4'-kinase [Alphaproteobacteria bacterium]|nr:tetraacyldisaccharide 4'-kinase [Alphaproteobacteria bacterium]